MLNNQGVYLVPGEVTGSIVVVTDGPMPYNAITVSLKGYADVHWTETYIVEEGGRHHRHTRTETRHFHSHEDYINEVIEAEHLPHRVLNGRHVLPFRFARLSANLPSSFDGEHGHIHYELEARISTGHLHFDDTASAIVQIVDRVDINVPALMNPAQFEDEKTICCLCCASPPISLTVNLPRTGYCIGEGIELTASLDNGSGRAITLVATLTRRVTFTADGSTRESSNQLSSFQSPPVQGRTTFQWAPAEQLAIPSAIPTIANCGIINLRYNLRIEASIPWALDADIDIPITLGNVPPQSLAGQQPLPPPQYPPLPTNPSYVPYNRPQNQVPPPGAYQAPPSGAYQAPPPGAYQAPPPGAYQAPPPGAYQSLPPGAYQAPPPSAYQAPPPGANQVPPPGAYQAPPPDTYPPPYLTAKMAKSMSLQESDL